MWLKYRAGILLFINPIKKSLTRENVSKTSQVSKLNYRFRVFAHFWFPHGTFFVQNECLNLVAIEYYESLNW